MMMHVSVISHRHHSCFPFLGNDKVGRYVAQKKKVCSFSNHMLTNHYFNLSPWLTLVRYVRYVIDFSTMRRMDGRHPAHSYHGMNLQNHRSVICWGVFSRCQGRTSRHIIHNDYALLSIICTAQYFLPSSKDLLCLRIGCDLSKDGKDSKLPDLQKSHHHLNNT